MASLSDGGFEQKYLKLSYCISAKIKECKK
jgi:hypothetical protein